MQSIFHDDGLIALIVADDLTGACDAAAPFAGRMRVQVVFDPEQISGGEVVAINLASRDVPAEVAKTKMAAVADLARSRKPQLFLKKIDSIFRGNTYEEIAICLEHLPHQIAILAPAFPCLGRRVRSGRLSIEDIGGNSVVDLVSGLRKQGIECTVLASCSEIADGSLEKHILTAKADGVRLILCDAETQADLDTLAQVGVQLGLDILWFGSAGLSHAFANSSSIADRDFPRLQPHSKGPIVFCIGSDHPVTRRQIQYLKHTGAVTEVDSRPTACLDMRLALRDSTNILLWINRNQHDSAKIGDWLQPVAHRIGALVLSGGDTAKMVCDALEVETIELDGELLCGVPFGWMRGGPADGVGVVTKSGGFGPEDALTSIAKILQSEARTEA